MSEAIPASLTFLQPALQDSMPGAIGMDSERELLAIWKAIFERTHTVESPGVAAAVLTSQPVPSAAPDFAAREEAAKVERVPVLPLNEPEPQPAELVMVFVRGETVAVVVRNAQLAAEDALRCAFETAHELTGERVALRSLVMNGQTLFESAGRNLPQSSLAFVC